MPDHQTITPQNNMSDNQPPPAYDSLGPSLHAMALLEARWDRVRPANWYQFELGHKPNIVFHLSSRTNIIDILPGASTQAATQPFWRAKLVIWSENVPRMMRMGFHWSPPTNIIPGHEDIKLRPSKEITSKHSRSYATVGRGWIGRLDVYARSSQTIINFDLHWVTLGTCNVERADAWSWSGLKVSITRPGRENASTCSTPRCP
ncbi:uncharacterized protein F5Z01DRAFT_504594 [Emericellopsis atlantica]|uniref:Uncharacterized protein n=1 Tax=Emericellopsis atlantica TaxID=2614577 RepID=A0A9P7ZQ90_9HYPO|nr:uncharacterized protein F5Z01DRAFT_504594 [Emericellopsis atlantica]KAG9256313.1 hypothetical protein F5Z01DRAFT_504594 [Emericellopsis atlantica]